ncbi:MAG: HD domain-containing protein [Paludibacteraceae bacterium]|nr:HD domain-containing protein [Paludibacteraceae bacterium]
MTEDTFREVINRLSYIVDKTDFEGHVYAVGGCVRDSILGREIKDIDICVDLPDGGIRLAQYIHDGNNTCGGIVTYPSYGTAMFRLLTHPDVEIECVQTRKECYRDENSRNPETCYGTLEEDAMRRDLTINALYMDVYTFGIIDPTGRGKADITEHRLRVTSTPEIVYGDDPLRILRLCVFHGRLGWDVDDETYRGAKSCVDRLSIITVERIRNELDKMLLCDDPVKPLEMLRELGAMEYVMPSLCDTFGMGQNKYHSGTVWEHTMTVLSNMAKYRFPHGYTVPELTLRLAALLHDIGKVRTRTVDENGNVHFYGHEEASAVMCDHILRTIKYPNDVIADVRFLVRNHMRCKQWRVDKIKAKSLRKLQYECGRKYFTPLLALIDADNHAHAPEYCIDGQCERVLNETMRMISVGDDMFGYKLPINGDDIMKTFGLEPGKEVKTYLAHALKVAFSEPGIAKGKLLRILRKSKPNIDGVVK